MKSLFPILAGLTISLGAAAKPVALEPGSMKALFVLPVANDLSLESSWIDLVACPRGRCDLLIDRIKGSELKARGGFRVVLADDGAFQLVLKPSADVDDVVVARMAYASGWFPPAEICAASGTSQTCRYKLERDEATRALSMRIQVRK